MDGEGVTPLFVCLLIIWLCVFTRRHNPLPPKQEKRKWSIKNIKDIRIDGGKMLMAITNTLMLVQAGFPTGAWVACSRESRHGRSQINVGR